jgi:hypothetical protein
MKHQTRETQEQSHGETAVQDSIPSITNDQNGANLYILYTQQPKTMERHVTIGEPPSYYSRRRGARMTKARTPRNRGTEGPRDASSREQDRARKDRKG